MCELFAVSGKKPVRMNPYLKEFASHSIRHPDGWGLAFFDGGEVRIEKEPIPAYQSEYLKDKLSEEMDAQNMLGHIRLATKGNLVYGNCHPFMKKDNMGRTWTLIHNGTIFDSPILDEYVEKEDGDTDSERILCYVIDRINAASDAKKSVLTKKERFAVLDAVILTITPNNNKVNLIIYDGELFYVHTNFAHTLFQKKTVDNVVFATTPLDEEKWLPVPMNTLFAYENGELLLIGTKHGNEYFL